ncbi:MAG: AAA family ATPase [Acidobacteriota bacterium]|nr:AAA family ATPase [Acidobacteriota bacterium]
MPITVAMVGSVDRDMTLELRELGFRVVPVPLQDLEITYPPSSKGPDAFVFDIRELDRLPREVAHAKRVFPTAGVVIVATALDPNAMLEAMRVGVNEWVADPIKLDDVAAALRRVARAITRPMMGQTIAVLGAKGGVGSTTVAVNLATALQHASEQPTLMVDLHLAHGDAAVFLGVEPRFSVLDALENIHRMDETYLKGLVVGTKAGPDLLGSSNRALQGGMEAMRVRSLIEFATTAYRYVVLDCPRADPTMVEAIDAASTVVVVANQELATLRSATRIAADLRARCGPDRVKLAISRFDPHSDISVADVEKVMGGQVKYVFPSDYRAAVAALNRGEPLFVQNHSRLADTFDQFARDVGALRPKPKDAAKPGLLGRLSGRR